MDGAFSPHTGARLVPGDAGRWPRAALLRQLAARQELFERGRWARHVVGSGIADARTAWFGVGLVGRDLNRGLPIDVGLMVLAQEMVRRELNLARSEIVVADENALAAGWDPLAVRRRAVRTQRVLEALVEALGCSARVFLASSLGHARQRAELAGSIEGLGPYAALQLAQVEWMRRRGATIKIGWSLGKRGRGEVWFDHQFRSRFGPELSSLYVVPGRSLDPRRPRACPYVCADEGVRIVLDGAGDIRAQVDGKLDAAPERARAGYLRLLGKLARAHGSLIGSRPARDPRLFAREIVARVQRDRSRP